MPDEFHRAGSRLFDALQAGVCQENVVLITSYALPLEVHRGG